MEKFERECRHFRGDAPCRLHKQDGRECAGCADFRLRGTRILIIKLGSAGDVLRTTSILKAIKERYASGHVTWIVKAECMNVLKNNPYIDEIIPYGTQGLSFVQVARFDLAMNLDVTAESSALLALSRCPLKKGFSLDNKGSVYPVNVEALPWYDMSLSDVTKKKNTDTYHDIIHDIVSLERNNNRPVLVVAEEDRAFAANFAKAHGIDTKTTVIGVNAGGGNRWELKTPDAPKWIEIIRAVSKEIKARCVLFGGPGEKRKYEEILAASGTDLIDAGTGNAFGRFAALVDLCDAVLTPDTLAMHVGTARGKKVVALFGPTSLNEAELYGEGKKISSGIECLYCYNEICGKDPNCMNSLDPGEIVRALKELLNG